MRDLVIRDARDGDAEQLIALIGVIWGEYPGVVLDVDREVPELRAIARAFRREGGRVWVAERAGALVGSVGFVRTAHPDGIELRKLYVAKAMRRQGLGARLCQLVEDAARGHGADYVELWSDTRFTEAHRLYERRGYVRGPQTRALHDLSRTIEYYYRKDL
jgi:putative acetyltransferase